MMPSLNGVDPQDDLVRVPFPYHQILTDSRGIAFISRSIQSYVVNRKRRTVIIIIIIASGVYFISHRVIQLWMRDKIMQYDGQF
jgi:hypothetical protein